MSIQIITDSCCDTTPAITAALGLKIAPMSVTVDGTKEFSDNGNVDVPALLAAMKASPKPVATACSSPEDYAVLMREAEESVVITLSKHLSGSYNSACAARDMVLEEFPDKKIIVLNSKTAACGQTRLAFFLHDLIQGGATFEEVCEKALPFIDKIRTFFVLEDLGNLIKNGRIPKMAGMLGTVLMLRPIMGENGDGEIIPLEKVRGTQKALDRLVEMIKDATASLTKKSLHMVLTYCNCPERGAQLKKKLLEICPAIADVILVPTGAISTAYANDGGVVLAYA